MARWSGWGAGPAGAGSTGPSRTFLVGLFVGCLAVTGFLAFDGRVVPALVSGLAAIYFALRAFAGLGR